MAAPHRCGGVLHVAAECQDCGWQSFARNAMANAARHAKATGHHVNAEQSIAVGFNCTVDHEAIRSRPPHEVGEG